MDELANDPEFQAYKTQLDKAISDSDLAVLKLSRDGFWSKYERWTALAYFEKIKSQPAEPSG